ncbi:MAG: hypothetical protein ABIR84_09700 [Candidatus Nitrotoga sp.]
MRALQNSTACNAFLVSPFQHLNLSKVLRLVIERAGIALALEIFSVGNNIGEHAGAVEVDEGLDGVGE